MCPSSTFSSCEYFQVVRVCLVATLDRWCIVASAVHCVTTGSSSEDKSSCPACSTGVCIDSKIVISASIAASRHSTA